MTKPRLLVPNQVACVGTCVPAQTGAATKERSPQWLRSGHFKIWGDKQDRVLTPRLGLGASQLGETPGGLSNALEVEVVDTALP